MHGFEKAKKKLTEKSLGVSVFLLFSNWWSQFSRLCALIHENTVNATRNRETLTPKLCFRNEKSQKDKGVKTATTRTVLTCFYAPFRFFRARIGKKQHF
jgi:hypothetical protein